MKEITVQSWEQFMKIENFLDVGKPGSFAYAFRGNGVASWDLEPTLLRKLRDVGATEEHALKIEEQALAEFQSQAHLHLDPNTLSMTTDTLGWWTLMQHHGAPTRLLDWCTSIYVAAYFAVSSHSESPGAVWIVHLNTVEALMKEKHGAKLYPKTGAEVNDLFLKPGAPLVVAFMSRLRKTHRMVAQQGVFSICRNVLGNHGEVLRGLIPEDPSKTIFLKIVIPENLKTDFLRKLQKMNITANSLFPGLDGLARSIDELIQVIGSK